MSAPRLGSDAPTQKQRGLFLKIIRSPLFTVDERKTALLWLKQRATRQNIGKELARLSEQRRDRTGR